MKCNDKSWGIDRLLSLLIYITGSAMVYYTIFTNEYLLTGISGVKGYSGALYVVFIIFATATLYGNLVCIFFKYTLEKALDDRVLRKG